MLVQYMMLYKLLMEVPESNAPPMPVDDGLVGAFSNDATTMQSFFKVSIPVWRIIYIKELPECLPSNLYHQEWWTVLGMGFLHSDPASGTAAEKRQMEVCKMMDCFMEELPLHADNAASSVFWCGKNYKALRQEECQEILWELAEVNFHCSNVENLSVMHCFPDGDHLPRQLNIGVANYRLADPLWLR
ncbi:hypothetical protein F5146DRAFT_1004857 [Armillaria mellea]|nr:hypothetical protein F5146DRAFT_1004857 [Armillaria mellea]